MLVTHLQKLFFVSFLFALSGLTLLTAQTNSKEAGPYACAATTTTVPVWGKLVVNGNTVSCYYATGTATPTTWLPIGQPQTINFLNNPVLAGVYITAHNGGALSVGTVDNVTISPTPAYMLKNQDVGSPVLMG